MGDIALAALSTFAVASLNVGFGADGLFSFDEIAIIANVGGITSVLQGGKFGHGFISAGIGAAVGGSRLLRGAKFGEQIAVRSVVGGTLSEITGGKFANGAVTAAFAYAIAHGVQTLSADNASRPEEYTREHFGKAPDDPQAVFDEAIRTSENNPYAQAPGDSQVTFINKIAVGGCSDSSCDTAFGVKTFDTLDSAIIYANGSSNRAILNGAAYKGNAFIYRTATFTGSYEIGYTQPSARTVLSLGHVENTIRVIAHETGHLIGYQHGGVKMHYRERRAIQLHLNK